jgi:hypothetical protein
MALRYRQHAEELRAVAADPTAAAYITAGLLKIAADYEFMADLLEATDKSNKEIAKRLED